MFEYSMSTSLNANGLTSDCNNYSHKDTYFLITQEIDRSIKS